MDDELDSKTWRVRDIVALGGWCEATRSFICHPVEQKHIDVVVNAGDLVKVLGICETGKDEPVLFFEWLGHEFVVSAELFLVAIECYTPEGN